jgi:hypothetical protein
MTESSLAADLLLEKQEAETATPVVVSHSLEISLGDFELIEREDLDERLYPGAASSSQTRTCTQVLTEELRMEHNQKVLDDLKPGDLVEYKRNLYSHWAVYIGRNKIVHLHGENEGPLTLSGVALMPSVSRAQVMIDNYWSVVKNSYVYRNNSLDSEFNPLPVEQILTRAYEKVNDSNYNVFWYNCEHFAKNCRYGIESSEQAASVLKLLKFGYTVTNGVRNLDYNFRKMIMK